MAVRTLQARLHCVPETLEALWRTHKIFNDRLRAILALLFRMRRGESGDLSEDQALYREIALFITGCPANNAPYLLNSVCIKNWVPTSRRPGAGVLKLTLGLKCRGKTSRCNSRQSVTSLQNYGKAISKNTKRTKKTATPRTRHHFHFEFVCNPDLIKALKTTC